MKKRQPTIKHVLEDGREVSTIKGHMIPANSAAYNVIFEAGKDRGTKWQHSA